MGRGKSWPGEDDLCLAQAWIQVSKDSMIGYNKEGKTFWQSLEAVYSKLSPTSIERTISSLQSRWSDINKKTRRFNAMYLQFKALPRSGYDEEKYVQDVLALYRDEMNESFPFFLCWKYLREKPEWQIKDGVNKKKEKKEALAKKRSIEEMATNDGDEVIDVGDDVDVGDNVDEVMDVGNDIDEVIDVGNEVDEEVEAHPIRKTKATELNNAAQGQIEVGEKIAQALESLAETHEISLEFKIMSSRSMQGSAIALEWTQLMAEQILMSRKKKINERKREAEAEETSITKKKGRSEGASGFCC